MVIEGISTFAACHETVRNAPLAPTRTAMKWLLYAVALVSTVAWLVSEYRHLTRDGDGRHRR